MDKKKKTGILWAIYDNLEAYVGASLLIISCFILSWQVFTRYVLRQSASWTEETARYMFIWIIFLGISYAMKSDSHIRVDFAIKIWPVKMRRYVELVGDLLCFALAVIVVYYGYQYVARTRVTGQFGAATFFPVWYVWLAVPTCYALMLVRMIVNFVKKYYLRIDLHAGEGVLDSFDI